MYKRETSFPPVFMYKFMKTTPFPHLNNTIYYIEGARFSCMAPSSLAWCFVIYQLHEHWAKATKSKWTLFLLWPWKYKHAWREEERECKTYRKWQEGKEGKGRDKRETERRRLHTHAREERCVVVVMDNWSEHVRMVLCKLPRQPRHALMITEHLNDVVVPRHPAALLFFFPPTTLRVDSSWPWSSGRQKKKSSRNNFSLLPHPHMHTSSQLPKLKGKKKIEWGIWHMSRLPGRQADIFKQPFV